MSNFVNLLDIVYPVGSIYISMNAESPASTVGGTWTQITNRFLYSSTSSAATGGYEYEYMDIYVDYYYGLLAHADYDRMFTFNEGGGVTATYTKRTQANAYNISSNATSSMAAVKPSQQLIQTMWDNKPPYITCYMWYRTA